MKIKKLKLIFLSLVLMLSACVTVTKNQALNTIRGKYSDVLFIYVDAPNDAITSTLMVTHLKLSSSTTSEALTQMLRMSNKVAVAVAGESDRVTAATIRRAIEDAGAGLPKNGQLVIVGQPADFEAISLFAVSKGLKVDVIAPENNRADAAPVTIAPSTSAAQKNQEQVQKSSNTQMNKMLRRSESQSK
ncbi:hypothetical protein [Amphibiibacter pelophylacis]|uniref:Uncharacterized protein n=1 Tax=Amphibiibacter pelophylacis TaxID=1799477 RepID=A0ACC6P4M4_9BURK